MRFDMISVKLVSDRSLWLKPVMIKALWFNRSPCQTTEPSFDGQDTLRGMLKEAAPPTFNKARSLELNMAKLTRACEIFCLASDANQPSQDGLHCCGLGVCSYSSRELWCRKSSVPNVNTFPLDVNAQF